MRLSSRGLWLAITLFFLGTGSNTSHGYPIPEATFWELTEQAEVIVLANVERIEPKPIEELKAGALNDQVAYLTVQQVFKGAPAASISVEYSTRFRCPLPPRFYPGSQVFAFLKKHERHYGTVSMSYGAHYPNAEALDDERRLIKEAVAIQSINPVAPSAKTVWLVHAASRPTTRWHGLHGLLPHPDDYANALLRELGEPKPPGFSPPTQEQLKEIADGFIKDPVTDYLFPMVLKVLEGYVNKDVDQLAIGIVEAGLAQQKTPGWLAESLHLLRIRYGDVKPKAAPSRPFWTEVPVTTLRNEWQGVRKRRHLPTVAPIKLQLE